MSDWIKVTDRLPLVDQRAIIARPGSVRTEEALFTAGSRAWTINGLRVHPTHWHPWPEKPPQPKPFDLWWEEIGGSQLEACPAVPGTGRHWISKHVALFIWETAITKTRGLSTVVL